MARYPGADSPEQGGLLCHGPTRRLAAILAADVAGYSRLLGADDDEGTHEWLKAHPREPRSEDQKAHCRTVENTGDGLLTELPSVVEATRCAIEMRRAIHKQNTGVKGLWARGEWAQD